MTSKFDKQCCQLLTQTVLLLTLSIQDANAPGHGHFIISPMSITINPGEEAVFQCSHSEADYYRWRWNGTLLRSSELPMGIRLGIGSQFLMITGNEDYNHTEIVCIARFDEHMQQASEPAYLIISSIFVTTSAPPSSFTNPPSNKTVPQMTIAIFECQLPGAVIGWRINGTLLPDFIPPLANITASTNSRGSSVDLLEVLARPEYNKTTVSCIGLYPDGRQPQYSPEVYLLIQGPLSGVTNIERHPQVAELTWNAPFSLNLTDVEPDITYCVEVINKTCDNNNSLINSCDLSKPYLEDELLRNADLFEITIIPKSNILGAQAGLQQSIQEQYIHFNVSAISPVVRKVSNKTVDVTVYLRTNSLKNEVPPDSFVISLESLDRTKIMNFPSNYSAIYTDSLEIHILNVPYGDLWYCTIYATRCNGIKVSDITTLSTFDIQDIQVTMNSSRSILINCALINGSQAAGVLIVAYAILSDIPDIYYKVVQRNDQQEIQAEISCLPGESYNILLYVINENGLPIQNAASLPLTRSFDNQQSVDTNKDKCTDSEQEITYNFFDDSEGNGVCIECHEPCVAIVHQNISQINITNGFLNISHIVLINTTTENETVFECIQGIDLIDYQIGIISLIKLNKTTLQPPDDNDDSEQDVEKTAIIVPASLAAAAMLAIVTVTIIIINMVACIKMKRKKQNFDVKTEIKEGVVSSSTGDSNLHQQCEHKDDSEISAPISASRTEVRNGSDHDLEHKLGSKLSVLLPFNEKSQSSSDLLSGGSSSTTTFTAASIPHGGKLSVPTIRQSKLTDTLATDSGFSLISGSTEFEGSTRTNSRFQISSDTLLSSSSIGSSAQVDQSPQQKYQSTELDKDSTQCQSKSEAHVID